MEDHLRYHPETYLRADQLGTIIPPYRPTYSTAEFINAHHAFLSRARHPETGRLRLTASGLMDHSNGIPINGWLRIEDALKLYELGFYCSGDILELGSYEGLSTCLLAQAIIDSGRANTITTVDISYRDAVAENARSCGVDHIVRILTADAIAAIAALPHHHFPFVFVDHSHEYEAVKAVCLSLTKITSAGGFVLFHDYNDARNGKDPQYGVFQAVIDHLPKSFRFCGVYGCMGLYRAE